MNKKENILVVLLAIVALAVVIVNIISNKKTEEKIIRVTNYSDFYTVDSCVDRVVGYIANKDTKNLLLSTSKKYIKSNKIDESNVLDFYIEALQDSTFSAKDMYYQQLNKIEKYYILGTVNYENNFEDLYQSSDEKETYFIVYLDKSNGIFSIEPYDGAIFKRGIENE